jgi:catechol 2,3-dioxygenase-like lactoylglutathione lyase family enzyme
MPHVVGIDHLVLSVGDLARSKAFYGLALGFLGFKLKYDYADTAGFSNRKTLFWIAQADAQGRSMKLEGMVYKPTPKRKRRKTT